MVKIILALFFILLFYLLIVYLNDITKEGMCSLDEYTYNNETNININKSINVYYGEIGSATVRTLPNGDQVIVNVDKNSDVDTAELDKPMVFYSENGNTITVYKTNDGDYVISKNSEITDGSVQTFYGNNGSVTVQVNANGTKDIIDYNTSYPNDVTSVQSFYGPNGGQINVIRTPDGQLKLVTASVNGSISGASYNRNDYILKTQVVPPVCPSCPAITCADCDNSSSSDDTSNDSSSNGSSSNGSSSNSSSSNSSSSNSSSSNSSSSNKSSSNSSSSSDSTSSDSTSNTTSNNNTSTGTEYTNDIISNGIPIGSYLNDQPQGDPMPILNDFSKFS